MTPEEKTKQWLEAIRLYASRYERAIEVGDHEGARQEARMLHVAADHFKRQAHVWPRK